MTLEVVCPHCSGRTTFKLERCGRSHKAGHYQCEICGLKSPENVATNAVPEKIMKEIAALGWLNRVKRGGLDE